jgi:hypothetical protein
MTTDQTLRDDIRAVDAAIIAAELVAERAEQHWQRVAVQPARPDGGAYFRVCLKSATDTKGTLEILRLRKQHLMKSALAAHRDPRPEGI